MRGKDLFNFLKINVIVAFGGGFFGGCLLGLSLCLGLLLLLAVLLLLRLLHFLHLAEIVFNLRSGFAHGDHQLKYEFVSQVDQETV